MPENIWMQCDGIHHITTLTETAWRLVEAQEITSTRKLVDSLEEQVILEDLIESNKPPLFKEYSSYHPLFYTPFRYPPLKYGSRFGSRLEPGLWYGSLDLDTVMFEKAFYKFNFLRASMVQYDDPVIEPLTIFSARIKTFQGIKLTEKPFFEYTSIISSPIVYEESQALGSAMRVANVQAFTYISSRNSINKGINIGLFTPKAFLSKGPDAKSFQSWQCIAHNDSIEFVRSNAMSHEARVFSLNQFIINGELPFPAN